MSGRTIAQWLCREVGIGLLIGLSACRAVWPLQIAESPKSAQIQAGPSLPEKIPLGDRWIVSAVEAKDFVQQGALVLDAYGRTKGAVSITWQQFSQTQPPHRGKLLENDANLTQQLQSLGVSASKPVLVIGNPKKGWGEEGRIVWMLRSLGHPQAYMVDGGRRVLQGVEMASVPEGDFVVKRDRRWSITGDSIRLDNPNVQLIDSREPREFAGQTPYGESRGGHIPGAKNLHFKTLLNRDGTLLPYSELMARIKGLGIMPSSSVVVYCTGGIRSGWLTTVLVSLGYQARNYPGSMWAWSASPAEHYPLRTLPH